MFIVRMLAGYLGLINALLGNKGHCFIETQRNHTDVSTSIPGLLKA